MASTLRHFADPHLLLQTQYNSTSNHICDICRSKMAGLTGYRCNACGFNIHEACVDYFKETVSFFAHPWHSLTLRRIPSGSSCGRRYCDLCMEGCPPGNLMYRCVDCGFDVHPLCTMLPYTVRSPLHPEHELRMAPGKGTCDACCKDLPVWRYVCACPFKLHIACVSGAPTNSDPSATTSGKSNDTCSSGDAEKDSSTSAADTTTPAQGSSASQTAGSSSVHQFLLWSILSAFKEATQHMGPVLDVISAAFQ